MDCLRCGKENRKESKFCRFCGADLIYKNFSSKAQLWEIYPKLKFSRRTLFIAGVLLLLGISTAYAAPKVTDYFAVKKAINAAKDSEARGDYKNAFNILSVVGDRWMLESTRQELENLEKQESSFIQNKSDYDSAILKESTGDLKGARDVLKSIPSNFPEYQKVQDEISSIQSKIENQLDVAKNAAEQKAAAAKAAAAQAAQNEANAEAQAEADRQAAAAAQAQAQQEALQKNLEIEKSFQAQLITAYNIFYNTALPSYNSAISYLNNGYDISAISSCTSVATALNSALNAVSDLNYRFTGLSSNYYNANTNMMSAINSLSAACNSVVNQTGSSIDYSSNINTNKNNALYYASLVKTFFDANPL